MSRLKSALSLSASVSMLAACGGEWQDDPDLRADSITVHETTTGRVGFTDEMGAELRPRRGNQAPTVSFFDIANRCGKTFGFADIDLANLTTLLNRDPREGEVSDQCVSALVNVTDPGRAVAYETIFMPHRQDLGRTPSAITWNDPGHCYVVWHEDREGALLVNTQFNSFFQRQTDFPAKRTKWKADWLKLARFQWQSLCAQEVPHTPEQHFNRFARMENYTLGKLGTSPAEMMAQVVNGEEKPSEKLEYSRTRFYYGLFDYIRGDDANARLPLLAMRKILGAHRLQEPSDETFSEERASLDIIKDDLKSFGVDSHSSDTHIFKSLRKLRNAQKDKSDPRGRRDWPIPMFTDFAIEFITPVFLDYEPLPPPATPDLRDRIPVYGEVPGTPGNDSPRIWVP